MDAIVLADDELKLLEKRFGPDVRQMGPWNSDGTFGHSSVPIVAVEKAAEALGNPNLMVALSRIKQTPEQTKPFIELLETFGPALIERIVAAYRERSLELITGTRLASKPPKQIPEVSRSGQRRDRRTPGSRIAVQPRVVPVQDRDLMQTTGITKVPYDDGIEAFRTEGWLSDDSRG